MSEFQSTLYKLFKKKTAGKNAKTMPNNANPTFEKQTYKNDFQNNANPYVNNNVTNMNNNIKNLAALPPFMTAQPPSNPLQPLLDLFQNNPSSVPPAAQLYGGMFPSANSVQMHPSPMNPMQDYLNGITNTNIYANQFGSNSLNVLPKINRMPQSPFNLPKQNPQHLQNSNIIYNTGNI